jgi:hypothetical protein
MRLMRTVAHGMATPKLARGFGFAQDVQATYLRLIQAILQHLEE